MTDFDQKIWDFTQKIPRGKVATYADLARMAGYPRAARAVGNALNKNLYRDLRLSKQVPCHRVIRSDGGVGGFAGGTKIKINLLEKEGVKVLNGRIDLVIYGGGQKNS